MKAPGRRHWHRQYFENISHLVLVLLLLTLNIKLPAGKLISLFYCIVFPKLFKRVFTHSFVCSCHNVFFFRFALRVQGRLIYFVPFSSVKIECLGDSENKFSRMACSQSKTHLKRSNKSNFNFKFQKQFVKTNESIDLSIH